MTNQSRHMVNGQILTNKVEDGFVLAALEAVPREEFVPENLRGAAYVDEDVDLGEGRFLMEPMVFARLLEIADIKKTEKVLVVASATGYPVAVIAALAEQVVGLENNINFISIAQKNLKKLAVANGSFVKAELENGAERHKPYDLIFINGAVDEVPAKLLSQLSKNGRVVTVKTDAANPEAPGFAVLLHKNGNVISESKLFQAFTPRLPEFEARSGFKF